MHSAAFKKWLEGPEPQAQDEDEIAWSAWQASRAQALQEAFDLMLEISGCKATRLGAVTAIKQLKDNTT